MIEIQLPMAETKTKNDGHKNLLTECKTIFFNTKKLKDTTITQSFLFNC